MNTDYRIVAVEYIRAGFALIPIPRGEKGPRASGWQLEENAIRTEEQAARLNGGNIGLAHRWCGTCAVDIDAYQTALPWLEQHGIDLQSLLLAHDAVQVISGKPNRAKLLYRLPDGVEWLPTHKIAGLELRCASRDGATTVQDVLPPSLHPDTGKPYEWGGAGDWRRIPTLPDTLLKLWRELSALESRQGPRLGIEHDPVLASLDNRGMVLGQIHGKLGGWSVRCPWVSEHTGEGGKADTAYFEPHTNGYAGGAFNCLHSHCANRGIRELQVWLGPQPVAENAPAGAEVVSRCLAGVQAKPIQWLWPKRIARGKLTVVAGHPGLGKSQLTVRLAAVVSSGGQWPVDRTRCEPGSVVLLSAEDDAEDTIRPRLEAAGADLTRCHILEAVRGVDDKGNPWQRAFSLKADIERLGDLLAKIGNVRLVVVDPISAYLGDTDSHKNADVRALLSPLGEVAAKHGAAVVAVSHFNKGGQQDSLMRVMGSLAFVAAARAAYAVVKDQDNPKRRLFLPLKNNIGNDETGYAFTVESVTLPGGIETCRVMWESDPVTMTADEAMASTGDTDERSITADAMVFLEGILADGPVTVKQIKHDSDGAGYSWATIRVAQKKRGIEALKLGMKEGWVWKLPPKALVDTEGASQNNISAFKEGLAPSGAELPVWEATV